MKSHRFHPPIDPYCMAMNRPNPSTSAETFDGRERFTYKAGPELNTRRRQEMETHRKYWFALVMLTTITLTVFWSWTPAAAQKKTNTNDALKTVIIDRLSKHGLPTRDNVTVEISNDTIKLAGTVSSLADKSRAADDVLKLAEGYTLVNNLTIESVGVSDKEITDKIVKALQGNMFYGVFDWVNVAANNGVVTLTGWAYDSWHRTLFEHLAEKTAGVTEVQNQIKPAPLTPWDDNLRRRAALLIYDNPDLDIFSRTITPPVHIVVVNDEEVDLEGYVTSNFQKNWIALMINGAVHPNKLVNDLKVG
jgi:osmotically-inducible protein OsmY